MIVCPSCRRDFRRCDCGVVTIRERRHGLDGIGWLLVALLTLAVALAFALNVFEVGQ